MKGRCSFTFPFVLQMSKDVPLCPQMNVFPFQTPQDVHRIHFLFQITGQEVDVVFRDSKAAVTEYLLERHHGTAHQHPLFGEGMPEAVNAGLLQAPLVAIVPDGMIIAASGELFAVDGAEQPILSFPWEKCAKKRLLFLTQKGVSLFFLFLYIADQLCWRTVHDAAEIGQCFCGHDTVMPQPLKRSCVDPLIRQIVVGYSVFLHELPHGRKRDRHSITSMLLYVA